MALCRLLEEQLLMAVAQLDIRGGGVNPFIERLAKLGLPEDEGEYEEGKYEEGEYEIAVADEDELSPDEEDDDQLVDTDQDEDDNTGDEDDWSDSFSHDSGYDSLSEDEEDEEDVEEDVKEEVEEDDDGNIRPCSPLIQQFPPTSFWQRWEQVSPPVPAGAIIWPCTFDVQHLETPAHQVEHAEDGLPSASQRSKQSAPSTSGLGFSTKRSREESETVQASTKKQKGNCEDSHDESAASTSGLGFSTKRSREENNTEEVSMKRQKWNCEDIHEAAPLTSGLASYRSREDSHRESAPPAEDGLPSTSQWSKESAPSTSGLGSSTKRSREESNTVQVSTKRQKWNCEDSHDETSASTSGLGSCRSREDSYRESAPSTSGLGSYRSREDSYRESAPSTSGLGSYRSREDSYRESAPSPFRKYWRGPFDYLRGTEDSDSD
ncbi:microtubule-associated protein futsch-like [Etheostoma cragini]|uniref:microtubule-associated protein futsch-like n=1 Tax=Etheostoma cragini TaxID=417921 RepID=UPI00155EBA00|nr:microtubule-associated protein futsch-like [Etheostoma cragini]